ncbi:MAG: 2-hydroxychromene-2-carboxylate isomerase [Deltaproteobacteria bacterium]
MMQNAPRQIQMARVRFYFDFISPYSYLASQLVRRAPYDALDLEYVPVTFGSILAKLDAKGPGEIPHRRKHQLMDVLLLARHLGLPCEGPPTHPFNSVYALRSVCAVQDPAKRAALTTAYFAATWGRGEALDDLEVLRRILGEVGIDHDPEEVATTREHRAALKANTKALLEAGGWGVPTFEVDGLLFWGQDRLDLLLAYLERGDAPVAERDALLTRPQPGRIT